MDSNYPDFDSLITAMQAISSDLELNRLLDKVLRVVIDYSGAQLAVLLLKHNNHMQVAGIAEVTASGVETVLPENEAEPIKRELVHFVKKFQEKVVVEDATKDSLYARDPYIVKSGARSLLCLPMEAHDHLVGRLYLQSQVPCAFTSQKIHLLEILLSQTAISLENARKYAAFEEGAVNYRRIVDTANEGIWVIGPDEKTLFVNRRMAKILGFSIEEMIGKPFTTFIPVEEQKDHLKKMEARRLGMSETYERRFLTKYGQAVWTLVSATSLFDEEQQFKGSFAMIIDITERKQAEERISLLNFALEIIHEAVFLIDREARFRFVNQEACRSLGYTHEELIGMSVTDIDPEFPMDHWAEEWEYVKQNHSLTFETYHHRKDGSVLPVEINTNYLEFEGKSYHMALARDITERRQEEQKLEQRVIDRTAELDAANRELEAFAYSVSHDLRAPLRHINGFMNMLQERAASSVDEESQHYMDVILESTRRMDKLIDDLLSFSRMARQPLSKAPVNVTQLVDEVIRELEPEEKSRKIIWKISEIPEVTVDRALLKIVLVNLISNALKFTGPREQAEIEIGCQEDAVDEVVLFVRDNGVGFDMKYANKLFGVFQRLHSESEFEGTGIGLANVRRIITRHGGKTWAEGEVGKGAAIFFSIPKPKDGA